MKKNKIQTGQKIILEPLDKNFPRIAKNLFNEWKKQHKKNRGKTFIQIDEEETVIDFYNAVSEGLSTLLSAENYNESKPECNIYFLYEFITSYLNSRWWHEYDVKAGDEYKSIVALKTLARYCENNPKIYEKLKAKYKAELIKDVNFSDIDTIVSRYSIDMENHKMKEVKTNFTGTIKTVLANVINSYVVKLSNMPHENYDLNISSYLDKKLVRKLIELNLQ